MSGWYMWYAAVHSWFSFSRARHFKVGHIWMYDSLLCSDGLKTWKLIFLPYIVGMAMDEEMAWQDVASLCTLLEATAPKGKKSSKHKEKSNEERITFENLEQYPFVMLQSAWELRWDRVHALYKACSSIPAFIIDDSVITQWSLKVSFAANPQQWLGSEDPDTLYAHAVLLSLMLLCILKMAECCKQGDHGADPVRFVYSAVVVFVHPAQVLSSIENAVDFYKLQHMVILQGGHSSGWCILCKLPCYETSRYFPAIPRQPFLALPITPDTRPQLCLDSASCDADCMLIWKLHHIQCHNTDYAMMPLAFRTSLMLPWEIWMEEYSKLWENEVFMMWKAGSPGVNVGPAMNFVCTCRTEYDAQRMILDISDAMIFHYPSAHVDEEDAGDSTREIPDDDNDDDDDDDVDDDIQQTATEIGTKSDDSSFHGSGVRSVRIDALTGPGVKWMGEMPSYQMTAPAISSHSTMHTSSCNVEAAGQSFNTFIKHRAAGSGVGDVMGGQALLHDFTTPQELESLCALANEQVAIAHHFDTKFSNTVFTLLKKVHKAFIMTGRIVQKFVDDMATASLNFIRDATAYEEELSLSDGVVFAASLTHIWNRIAELIREASELEVVYEESQKKFTGVLKQVEEEVGKYLETQSMADSTVFMDESFDNLQWYSNSFNILPFVPVVVGMAVMHHALLTSLWVNVSHFPFKLFLSPLESDATAASGQMALLQYMTQQSITIQEGQAKIVLALRAGTGDMNPTIESDHSYMASRSRRPKLEQWEITPCIQDKK